MTPRARNEKAIYSINALLGAKITQISGPILGTRGWGTAVGYSRVCIVHWWRKWLCTCKHNSIAWKSKKKKKKKKKPSIWKCTISQNTENVTLCTHCTFTLWSSWTMFGPLFWGHFWKSIHVDDYHLYMSNPGAFGLKKWNGSCFIKFKINRLFD